VKFFVTKLFYVTVLISAILSISTVLISTQAQDAERYSIVCIRNQTSERITFEFKWGSRPWEISQVEPQQIVSINWKYRRTGKPDNPKLHISFDADLGKGKDKITTRVESITHRNPDCTRDTHHFRYESGTTRFIELISDLD